MEKRNNDDALRFPFSSETPRDEIFKLPPYLPPDSLINALVYAIDRKAWPRARKLARELRFYDLERASYLELEYRLNQILSLIDQRLNPRSVGRRSTFSTMSDSNTSTPRRSASRS